jgi:hypothetical protein
LRRVTAWFWFAISTVTTFVTTIAFAWNADCATTGAWSRVKAIRDTVNIEKALALSSHSSGEEIIEQAAAYLN